MELNERARKYAADKALESITKAIEQAYKDGYTDGYDDGKGGIAMANHDCEYVDLGLPSGTRWANDFIREGGTISYMTYNDAKKLNIPTRAQLDELLSVCQMENGEYRMDKNHVYTDVIGPNGNSIRLTSQGVRKGYKLEQNLNIMFWIKSAEESDDNKRTIYCRNSNRSEYDSIFLGYKLPVLLVE